MLRAHLVWVGVCILVALVACPRPAAAAASVYGDGNQAFDGSPGSPDLLDSYGSIPLFKLDQMLNVWPKATVRGETDDAQTNLSWQWALWQHEAYGYTDLGDHDLLAAILVIEERVMPEAWATGEALQIYDEAGSYATNLGWVHAPLVGWLQAEGVTDWQWVCLEFDLLGGDVQAWALDADGDVDTSLGTAGLLGTLVIPDADRDAILSLASDGELWGEVSDDFALSRAAMDVTVIPEPAMLSLLALGGVALLVRRRRG